MNQPPAIPPPFSFRDKALEKKIELIVYNFAFRQAVQAYRDKWDQRRVAGSGPHDPANWEESDADIADLLTLFDPPLPVSYHDFIYRYANFNEVLPMAPLPPLELEEYAETRPLPSDEEFNVAVEGYVARLAKAGTQLGGFDIDLVKTRSGHNKIRVDVYEPLSGKEWQHLRKSIEALSDKLPRRSIPSTKRVSIRQLALVADLYRATNSYRQVDEQLAEMGYKHYTESTLRSYLTRARALGL